MGLIIGAEGGNLSGGGLQLELERGSYRGGLIIVARGEFLSGGVDNCS